jgi:hypothetical protein
MSKVAVLHPNMVTWGPQRSPLSDLRSDIDALSARASSQERYSNYTEAQRAGLVETADKVIKLSIEAENYTKSQTETKARLDKQTMLMEQMYEGITKFQASVITYRSGAGQANQIDLKALATKALETLQAQLNDTGIDGSFLFGSLNTNIAPVGDIVTDKCLDVNNNPTTSYTKDSGHPTYVELSDSIAVRVDTFVGSDAFRNLIGGLQVFALSPAPLTTANLDDGAQLLNKAASQMKGLITNTKMSLTKFEQAENNVADLKLQAAEIHDKLLKYDIVDSMQAIADAQRAYEYMIFIQGMLLRLPRLSDSLQ